MGKESMLSLGQKLFLQNVICLQNNITGYVNYGEQSTIGVSPESVAFNYDMTPRECIQVKILLGKVFGEAQPPCSIEIYSGSIDREKHRRDIRQLRAQNIDRSPGSHQVWEEQHGKNHIFTGHYPTGRNHSGRTRTHGR